MNVNKIYNKFCKKCPNMTIGYCGSYCHIQQINEEDRGLYYFELLEKYINKPLTKNFNFEQFTDNNFVIPTKCPYKLEILLL